MECESALEGWKIRKRIESGAYLGRKVSVAESLIWYAARFLRKWMIGRSSKAFSRALLLCSSYREGQRQTLATVEQSNIGAIVQDPIRASISQYRFLNRGSKGDNLRPRGFARADSRRHIFEHDAFRRRKA